MREIKKTQQALLQAQQRTEESLPRIVASAAREGGIFRDCSSHLGPTAGPVPSESAEDIYGA